jgi:hypothetical protein
MNLMDLLQWQLSDGVVTGIDKELGVNNPQKTNMAANAALSVLMSALNKNSQSSDALSGLMGALDRDHDGGILDELLGTLSGRVSPQNQKTVNGAGILGHLLGGKQSTAVEALTKMTGLDSNQSMNILAKLAPLVLGVLGRVKKQKHLDNSKMRDFLRESQEQYEQQNTSASLFSKLLDKDGDGNVMDEIAGMGMKMLGNWLR